MERALSICGKRQVDVLKDSEGVCAETVMRQLVKVMLAVGTGSSVSLSTIKLILQFSQVRHMYIGHNKTTQFKHKIQQSLGFFLTDCCGCSWWCMKRVIQQLNGQNT